MWFDSQDGALSDGEEGGLVVEAAKLSQALSYLRRQDGRKTPKLLWFVDFLLLVLVPPTKKKKKM